MQMKLAKKTKCLLRLHLIDAGDDSRLPMLTLVTLMELLSLIATGLVLSPHLIVTKWL